MHELEESNKAYIFNSLEKVDSQNEEEVKARLVTNLKKVREFIKAISSGNYGITWEGMNDENKDVNHESIAGELLNMRNQMELVKEQDQIRIWTTEGLSKFSEIIRNHQDNFDKLSETLISNVVNYVGAKVGDFLFWKKKKIKSFFSYGRLTPTIAKNFFQKQWKSAKASSDNVTSRHKLFTWPRCRITTYQLRQGWVELIQAAY